MFSISTVHFPEEGSLIYAFSSTKSDRALIPPLSRSIKSHGFPKGLINDQGTGFTDNYSEKNLQNTPYHVDTLQY